MVLYSDQLAQDYAQKRHKYQATDAVVFSYIDKIGVIGKKILDFGCGDGVYGQEFLNRGAVEVFGIDESKKMIEMANEKYNSSKGMGFQVADGNDLPFDNDDFDIVFANFVLHHFVDTARPLSEIFRVLKKGGYLVATLNAYDIPENLNITTNTQVPIKLGLGEDTTPVHNILKSHKQIKTDLINSNFKIETYIPIKNADAHIDENYPYKNLVKLVTMLIIVKK